MPIQTEQPTYQTCAVMGGAQLANGNLMNLGRAQFTFKPPNCSYSSEPHHCTDLITVSDTRVVYCPVVGDHFMPLCSIAPEGIKVSGLGKCTLH